MNDERASLVERLEAEAADLLGETPTLFAYGIATFDRFALLRDVHLAAYMDPNLPPESYFHVEIRLETLLEETLAVPVAGARILNNAPLTVQGAVLMAGRAIYSRDEELRIAFEAQVRRTYLDFMELLVGSQEAIEEDAVTIRRNEVATRLDQMADFIGRVRSLVEFPATNPTTEGASRYFFQSAVTCSLTICLDLIASLKLRPPRDVTDIPEILAEVGLLEAGLARDIRPLLEIRSQLVRDPDKGSDLTSERLAGLLVYLERFAQAIRVRCEI